MVNNTTVNSLSFYSFLTTLKTNKYSTPAICLLPEKIKSVYQENLTCESKHCLFFGRNEPILSNLIWHSKSFELSGV